MSNTTVDYSGVIDIIREEIELTRRNDDRFENLKIIVEDERLLAKEKDRNPDTIYIQIKFGAAATNFGQAVLPFSMEVIGINQDIELTQDLLNNFVNTYNRNVRGEVTEFYLTPVVSQNNIPIYEGFRSLFIISGTYVVANNLIDIELEYKWRVANSHVFKYEKIEVISYYDIVEANLNPQPYPNTQGRTKSHGTFQTFAFTIVTYPNASSKLIQAIQKWKYDFTASHQDDTFQFRITVKKMDPQIQNTLDFKCRSADFSKKLGEIPVCTLSFTL